MNFMHMAMPGDYTGKPDPDKWLTQIYHEHSGPINSVDEALGIVATVVAKCPKARAILLSGTNHYELYIHEKGTIRPCTDTEWNDPDVFTPITLVPDDTTKKVADLYGKRPKASSATTVPGTDGESVGPVSPAGGPVPRRVRERKVPSNGGV